MVRPAKVDVGRFDITKAERTDSGRMTMEVIRAGVRRVDVKWTYMLDSDYKDLLDTLMANKPFFQVKYPDAGGMQTMMAYSGDVQAGLWYTINGVRRWEEVRVALIEQ